MEFIHQTTEVLISSSGVLTLTLLHCYQLTPLTCERKTPPVAYPLTVHFQLTQSIHKKTPNLSILQIPIRRADFCKGLNRIACSHPLPPTPCCVRKALCIRCSRVWSCLLWKIIINNNTSTPHWTGCRSGFVTATGKLAGHARSIT